jgi:hypothetical protein
MCPYIISTLVNSLQNPRYDASLNTRMSRVSYVIPQIIVLCYSKNSRVVFYCKNRFATLKVKYIFYLSTYATHLVLRYFYLQELLGESRTCLAGLCMCPP